MGSGRLLLLTKSHAGKVSKFSFRKGGKADLQKQSCR